MDKQYKIDVILLRYYMSRNGHNNKTLAKILNINENTLGRKINESGGSSFSLVELRIIRDELFKGLPLEEFEKVFFCPVQEQPGAITGNQKA